MSSHHQEAQAAPKPVALGLRKSFGFGDRLGLATPGHLRAAARFPGFHGIFAQQSIRELNRTRRAAAEVMRCAVEALAAARYDRPWGADGDHLKTEEDVETVTRAGYTFFTIDPSDKVNNEADRLGRGPLETEVERQVADGVLPADWKGLYLGRAFEVSESLTLAFGEEDLLRGAVKYGRAIHRAATMAEAIARLNQDREIEIEVSVDETDSPTSLLEHLFFASELKRRGVSAVSLAPRFVGDFEKGIDFKGDLEAFERSLAGHVAIAKAMGPYKISVHSGSDKFSAYPAIGRQCGDLLHVKTAGTSYLEALRVACRKDPRLFDEIVDYAVGRFPEDKATYQLAATEESVAALARRPRDDRERLFLEDAVGRQLLHVTFGSVYADGERPGGQSFREALMALLEKESDLYAEVLEGHFVKHLQLLSQG